MNRRPRLFEALSAFLVEAERDRPIFCGFDVVPERASGRDVARAERRSGIIQFDVAQRDLGVVLDGDVHAGGMAAEGEHAKRHHGRGCDKDHGTRVRPRNGKVLRPTAGLSMTRIESVAGFHARDGPGKTGSLRSRILALSTTPLRLSCSLSEKTSTFQI